MRSFVSTIAIAVLTLVLATPIALGATANRTWVKSNGTAGNAALTPPCTLTNPCDTFTTALGATNAGGEINCVDSGSYGSVIIAKSVTIDCGAQLGTIDPTGSVGVEINSASAVVKLRGLTINGNGGNAAGVSIPNGASVTIENCVIRNLVGSNSAGIYAATLSPLLLYVTDTLIAETSSGGIRSAIVVTPTGSGTIGFVFDRVRVENNADGIVVDGTLGTGAVKGFIRDSIVSGNANAGGAIRATTSPSAAQVTISVYRTHVVGNNGGVGASNGAAVILSNSTIQANATGLSSSGGGVIFSYGNNDINANQPNGIGSAPVVIAQH